MKNKNYGPLHALTMVVILYLFCYVLIKTAKAEPEQNIILVPDEPIIIEQSDPDDETSKHLYISRRCRSQSHVHLQVTLQCSVFKENECYILILRLTDS